MRKIPVLVAFFILTGHYLSMAQENNSFAVQVRIEYGIIEGNYDTKTGIQKYFGIPFAKPPVDDLRWKAPQPPDKWEGTKISKKFGPRPMQTDVFGDMDSRSDGGDQTHPSFCSTE